MSARYVKYYLLGDKDYFWEEKIFSPSLSQERMIKDVIIRLFFLHETSHDHRNYPASRIVRINAPGRDTAIIVPAE